MNAPASPQPPRAPPLAAWYRKLGPDSRVIEVMAFPTLPAAPAAALKLRDRSWRRRFGCKGPAAETWLSGLGLSVPRGANSARIDAAGVLVARLATSEFLVEAIGGGATAIVAARAALAAPERPAGVYPVVRQDLVVELSGPATRPLLRQICSVDFEPLLKAATGPEMPVVLTSMVGVGVVAWPGSGPAGPCVTLWSDPSFADYFWSTLLEVGAGLDGGVAVQDPGGEAADRA